MKEKKKKPMKIIVIVLIVLAILIPVQLAVMGWFGGIGPLGSLKDVRMGRMAGNAEEYSFELIEQMENSPLEGGNICILGSSVVYGTASQRQAVGEYLTARLGATLTKEAVSGTTLCDTMSNSYIRRMLTIDTTADFDLFICQLSTNDATQGLPVGEISDGTALEDFDTSTVTGALEYIICYAQHTWDCPVVFFTGSRYDSETYGAMVSRLLELQDKWDIGVLDLWTDDGFNTLDGATRSVYMADGIHPSKAGYRDWWGPELERQLLAYLSEVE